MLNSNDYNFTSSPFLNKNERRINYFKYNKNVLDITYIMFLFIASFYMLFKVTYCFKNTVIKFVVPKMTNFADSHLQTLGFIVANISLKWTS